MSSYTHNKQMELYDDNIHQDICLSETRYFKGVSYYKEENDPDELIYIPVSVDELKEGDYFKIQNVCSCVSILKKEVPSQTIEFVKDKNSDSCDDLIFYADKGFYTSYSQEEGIVLNNVSVFKK